MSLEIMNLVDRLILFSLLIQTVELLRLKSVYCDTGVWQWNNLKLELNKFEIFFKFNHFYFLLLLRLLSIILGFLYPTSLIFIFLLFSSVLISLRWRGTFNGGSDFMTLIILTASCVSKMSSQSIIITEGCLWYVAIQTCTSYFLAGIVKIKKANWRNGKALYGFVNATIYENSQIINILLRNKPILLVFSWMILLFEISFPLVLVNFVCFKIYILIALCFHLANIYVFGLNRFFWTWISTYPAIFYCCSKLSYVTFIACQKN